MITMLLAGLWHGASWTFGLLAPFYGCLLVLDRILPLPSALRNGPGRIISVPITFVIVCTGWVFFRRRVLRTRGRSSRTCTRRRPGRGLELVPIAIVLIGLLVMMLEHAAIELPPGIASRTSARSGTRFRAGVGGRADPLADADAAGPVHLLPVLRLLAMGAKNRDMRRRDRSILLWTAAFFVLLQAAGYALLQVTPRPERFSLGRGNVLLAPDICETIIHWQSQAVLTSHEPADIVFLGDSSCLMGVMPAVVEDKAKRPTRNIGTVAYMGNTGHADILDLYLERHPAPKVVVYHVCPLVFTVSNKDLIKVGYLQTFREYAGSDPMPCSFRQPRTWLPSYHLSRRLLARAEERGTSRAFYEEARGKETSDEECHARIVKSRGFLADPSGPCMKLPSPMPLEVRLNRDCIPGLKRIFAASEKHHFKLVLTFCPISDNYQTPETEVNVQELLGKLRELAAPYPQVDLSPRFLRYYPATSFAWTYHLREDAAATHSAELGDWLGQAYFPPATSIALYQLNKSE